MLCYEDKTFCEFYKDCRDQDTCSRPLTKEVEAAANEWWKSFDLPDVPTPISLYWNKPECHREQIGDTDNEEE